MKTILVTCLLALGLTLGGCADCPTCGKLTLDSSVSQAITDQQISSTHDYYASGRDGHLPNVIVALDKSYALQAEQWKKVTDPESSIPLWIESSKKPSNSYKSGLKQPYRGFAISNPDGEQVGVWYGNLSRGRMSFPSPGVMELGPPQKSALASKPRDD